MHTLPIVLQAAAAQPSTSLLPQLTQDLIVTVVDKLVIGVVVLTVGYFLNRALERYKARDALTKEVARKRVDEMGRVWSVPYSYDVVIGEMEFVTGKAMAVRHGIVERDEFERSEDDLMERGQQLTRESMATKKEIPRVLESARYWVGEDTYQHYRRYFDAQAQRVEYFFRALAPGAPEEETEACWQRHEDAKHDVVEARRDVLGVVAELTW